MPKCRMMVQAEAVYCQTCGLPLTVPLKPDNINNNAVTEMLTFLSQNPQILAEALAKARN